MTDTSTVVWGELNATDVCYLRFLMTMKDLLLCVPLSLSEYQPDLTPTATTPQIWAYQEPNLQGASGIMLEELPRELLKVAQSPIIKGVGIGIAGNIKEVIEARRLVRDCLELKDGHDVKARCDKWMERMCAFVDNDVDEQDDLAQIERSRRKRPRMRWEKACMKTSIDLPLLCPSCRSPV